MIDLESIDKGYNLVEYNKLQTSQFMKNYFTIAVFFFFTINLKAQNLTLTPGNQGKLNLPKLTYDQIQAIPSPESGSIVYDVTTNCVRYFNGTKWLCTDQKNDDFAPNAINAWKVSEINTTNSFQVNQMTIDSQGNIYIVGNFGGIMQVNGTTYTSSGFSSTFVIKYNNAGEAQWFKMGVSQNGSNFLTKIVVDNLGDVYLAGIFFNQVNFGGVIVTTNSANGDIFLCKLSTNNGNTLALKSFGGANGESIDRMFIDNLNNIYIVGTFISSCSFDAFTIAGIDSNDIYIVKCNSDLQYQWVNKIVGTNADEVGGVYGDNMGNIYVVGVVGSNATFAPGVNLSPGIQTLFVAKYDALNGNYIWHRSPVFNGSINYARRVVCDIEGYIYVSGNFTGNMTFGGIQLIGSSSINSDLFVAKIAPNGDMQWLQQSLSSDTSSESLDDMKISANNEIFIICRTYSNPQPFFGFGNKRYYGNNFVFKFDKNGMVKGGNTISVSNNNGSIQNIATYGSYYYVVGNFSGSISFGNILLSSSTYNGFVAKYID